MPSKHYIKSNLWSMRENTLASQAEFNITHTASAPSRDHHLEQQLEDGNWYRTWIQFDTNQQIEWQLTTIMINTAVMAAKQQRGVTTIAAKGRHDDGSKAASRRWQQSGLTTMARKAIVGGCVRLTKRRGKWWRLCWEKAVKYKLGFPLFFFILLTFCFFYLY